MKTRRRTRRLTSFGMFMVVLLGSVALLGFLRAVHTVALTGIPTPEGRPVGPVAIAAETAAAQATATAAPTPVPLDVPDPASCSVEPRSVDGMLAIVDSEDASDAPSRPPAAATPIAVGRAPESNAAPATSTRAVVSVVRPTAASAVGSAAPAATTAQIQRTVRGLVACGNAGELLQVWAYFSDGFVRRAAADQPALFNRTILTARVQSLEPRTDAMPRVSTVRLLPDGRVSASIAIPTSSPLSTASGLTGTATFVFVESNGRWVIDEARSGDGTGGP